MTSPRSQPLPGMSDIAAPEISLWQDLENKARAILSLYRFDEVRTPVLESTSLFTRSLGGSTDVVQKEMYTFEDRGGRSVSLRPEGTAGVIRHLARLGPEHAEARVYYLGPMFRAERPQAGRRRQFHQLGVEALGAPNPAADAEVIALQQHLFSAWGLGQCEIEINTRGLPGDRAAVAAGLAAALRPHLGELCEDCRRRYEDNILRVLDCKQEACRRVADDLPLMTSFMSEASRHYLDEVLRMLALMGIHAHPNPRLVRGLDYYIQTVWETRHAALGAQDAIAGGGRYQIQAGDRVMEGVGFAMGLERVITALQKDRPSGPGQPGRAVVWIVSQGQRAFEENLVLAQLLRQRGVRCGLAYGGRSLKAQMREANRHGVAHAVIRGDLEIEKGILVLKNMRDGAQEELEMPALVERLVAASRAEVLPS
jgi:histidyl-tRNA synthetase